MYIILDNKFLKIKVKLILKISENAFIKTATSQIVEYFYAKNVIVTTLDISARHSLCKTVSAFVWLQFMFLHQTINRERSTFFSFNFLNQIIRTLKNSHC